MSQGTAHRSSLSGQSLVEFAVVAPFFFILVFLIIEGGLFMNAQATIDNATREGARAAALCGSATIPTTYTYQGVTSGTGCQGLIAAVVQAHLGILNDLYPSNPGIIGTCTGSSSTTPGNPVCVQVTYTYSFLIPSILGLGPKTSIVSTAQEVSQQ
jgi:Flp pilus assembly protein TadG